MTPRALKALSEEDWKYLRDRSWNDYAGGGIGIWISAARQRLMVVRGRRVLRSYRCSTAGAGLGNVKDSGCTPVGWHEIGEIIGADSPSGAVFRGRIWTGEVWRPGQKTEEDLILSRILRLRGLQGGTNSGGEVDSWERFIYIHGTNAECDLGSPASKGCIRLSNSDVIELARMARVGCRVLIS